MTPRFTEHTYRVYPPLFFPGTIPKVWGRADLLDEPVDDAGPLLADVGRRPCIDDSEETAEQRYSSSSTEKTLCGKKNDGRQNDEEKGETEER